MQNVLIIGDLQPANKALFNEAESMLKSAGNYVVNPAKDYTLTMNDNVYFLRRYLESLTAVTAVYFLPNYYQLPFAEILQKLAKSLALVCMNGKFPVANLQSEDSEETNF